MNVYNHGGVLRGKCEIKNIIICRIGYELEESGLYRAGYAYIDSGSKVLSLVGDFNGLYTFDLVSGKKKKRSFLDKGCCIYSSVGGSLIGSILVISF